MVIFVLLNLVGIRWLARANNGITTWKVIIPVLTIIVLLATDFHSSNFGRPAAVSSSRGRRVKSILIAIPAGGIVFALLGFEQAVQLGGEAANPKRDLPRAVILSILIGAAIYILLQIAFIGAMSPKLLAQHGALDQPGSQQLQSRGRRPSTRAPFYTVAKIAGLAWLAFLLRLDAVISPAGTGLIYMTSSSRLSFGLSRNGYVPTAFEKTNERTRVPVFGVRVRGRGRSAVPAPVPKLERARGSRHRRFGAHVLRRSAGAGGAA